MDNTDILEHHGVKGMKWGVRNDKGHEGEKAKTKQIAKLDKKFEKNMNKYQTVAALHNRAAELANARVDAINNKPQYKGKDFTRDSPLRQKYYKEHQQSFLDGVTQAAKEMGTNASGTKEYTIIETGNGGWDIYLTDVKHADDQTPEFSVDVDYDEMGYIRKVMPPKETAHNDVTLEDFLAHYGVKGQKWGVRRYGSGRRKQPLKSKARNMSDEELKKSVERLRLEKEYIQISKQVDKSSAGKAFVDKHGSQVASVAIGAATSAIVGAGMKKVLSK